MINWHCNTGHTLFLTISQDKVFSIVFVFRLSQPLVFSSFQLATKATKAEICTEVPIFCQLPINKTDKALWGKCKQFVAQAPSSHALLNIVLCLMINTFYLFCLQWSLLMKVFACARSHTYISLLWKSIAGNECFVGENDDPPLYQ